MSTRRKLAFGIGGVYILGFLVIVGLFGAKRQDNDGVPAPERVQARHVARPAGPAGPQQGRPVPAHHDGADARDDALRLQADEATKPNRLQVAVEWLYTGMKDKLVKDNMDEDMARKWFPLVCTLFVFIWFSNMIGYLPLPVNTEHMVSVFGAVALTACGSGSDDDLLATVKQAAAGHSGAWTDDQLRAAAGEDANVVYATQTESDGVIRVELDRSGGTKTKPSSSGKKKTTRSDYEVDCVEVTIDGGAVDGREYSEESSLGRPRLISPGTSTRGAVAAAGGAENHEAGAVGQQSQDDLPVGQRRGQARVEGGRRTRVFVGRLR